MIVQHNMSAENTNRELGKNVKTNAKSIEKLSSGYRINRAADDAAGLAISEKMRAQIRGLDKGSFNSSEGIALLQVADGALSEVHAILDRTKELTVQAANDTYTDEDRGNIQLEIEALLDEIDRIGNETEYNTIKVFQGEDDVVSGSTGTSSATSTDQIPLSDCSLYAMPFTGTSGSEMNLGFSWNSEVGSGSAGIIFGRGGTSHPGIRVRYQDDNGVTQTGTFDLRNVTASDFVYNTDDPDAPYVSRKFTYNISSDISFDIIQKIQMIESVGYKYYDISHQIVNTGSRGAEVDFMYHADTAYQSDSEQYCLGGRVLEVREMYTSDPAYLSLGNPYVYGMDSENLSEGLAITNTNHPLPFSGKIEWDSIHQPDTFVLGYYNDLHDWSRYDYNPGSLGLGLETSDWGIALIWSDNSLNQGESMEYKIQYGVVETSSVIPLPSVHDPELKLWIQTAANSYEGFNLTIGEMNATVLGIRDIDLSTVSGAEEANAKIEAAIESLNRQRATIGAQHNRLEHVISIDDISSENTQASESKIRDTDMAKEMVVHAAKEILIQAGQSMLAQANNLTMGVLQLLG